MGLSAPLGLVSLASERAETPRAPKEGIIQRFQNFLQMLDIARGVITLKDDVIDHVVIWVFPPAWLWGPDARKA